MFTNIRRFCSEKAGKKMDESGEAENNYGAGVVEQVLSTKTSTLALMTTSIVLFLTLVAKRITSKGTEVILAEL